MMSDKHSKGIVNNEHFVFEFHLNYTKYVQLMQKTMKKVEYKVKPYESYYKSINDIIDINNDRFFATFSIVSDDFDLYQSNIPCITNHDNHTLESSSLLYVRNIEIRNPKILEFIRNDSSSDIGYMLLTTKIFDSLNTFIDIDKILGIGKYKFDL